MVVHCGTRSMGIYAFDYYMGRAWRGARSEYYREQDRIKEIAETFKEAGKSEDIPLLFKYLRDKQINRTPFLTRDVLEDYLHDVHVCEEWVMLSHKYMFRSICDDMGWDWHDCDCVTHSVHSTIDTNGKIVRKGATSAHRGQWGIVPLNMGDGSLIVRGKGNPDWLYSLPHGAGRIMGRAEARRNLSMDDYRESMRGIYTTCVRESTIDESPMSYKNADEIARAIEPNGEVVARLRPLYNYKAV